MCCAGHSPVQGRGLAPYVLSSGGEQACQRTQHATICCPSHPQLGSLSSRAQAAQTGLMTELSQSSQPTLPHSSTASGGYHCLSEGYSVVISH
ncbi:hypothetical protein AOLI_G00120890 [Acnodon oligacanthus]